MQMLNAVCVIYVKKAKNAIFEAYAIRHLSDDKAIWVSKDVSGLQECRPILVYVQKYVPKKMQPKIEVFKMKFEVKISWFLILPEIGCVIFK